jgi:hypothetical protein
LERVNYRAIFPGEDERWLHQRMAMDKLFDCHVIGTLLMKSVIGCMCVLFAATSQASEPATYRLRLDDQSTARGLVYGSVRDPVSEGGAPEFSVSVILDDASRNVRLRYRFPNLGVGDQLMVEGKIFRVDAITYHPDPKPTNTVVAPGSCVDHCDDVIDLRSTGESMEGAPGPREFVLAQAKVSTVEIAAGAYVCPMGLVLDAIDVSRRDHPQATVRVQQFGCTVTAFGNGVVASTESLTLNVGTVINFGGTGNYRVNAILPANKWHSDWVVMSLIER